MDVRTNSCIDLTHTHTHVCAQTHKGGFGHRPTWTSGGLSSWVIRLVVTMPFVLPLVSLSLSRALSLSRSLSLSLSRSLALSLSLPLSRVRALSLTLSLSLTHSLCKIHSVPRRHVMPRNNF
jgi:hypothetical protein